MAHPIQIILTRQLAGYQGPAETTISSAVNSQILIISSLYSIMRQQKFSLQANRKTREGDSHPDRDAQFAYINTEVSAALAEGQAVISVDTKKKELVGDFKNAGREWRRQGEPEEVRVHDFLIKELGRAVPYGIYDLASNAGWVSVGITHDTAAFAVQTICRWWQEIGRARYPEATELVITADGGGSNGYRVRLWKRELQRLADETGIAILSVPLFLVDPKGDLLFYNEPAEALLGRRFDETGAMPAEEWSTVFTPVDDEGRPIPAARLPLMITLDKHRPAYQRFFIRGLTEYAVTLRSPQSRSLGSKATSLAQLRSSGNCRNNARHPLRNSRINSGARTRDKPLRGKHSSSRSACEKRRHAGV